MLLDHAPTTRPSPPAAAPSTLADPPPVRRSLHPHPSERPVFLDPLGRRARRVKLASGGVAAATTLWLAGLVVGPLGFLSLPPAPPLATPIAWVAPAPTPLAGIPPLRPIATASAAVAPLRLAASILDVDPAASVPRSAAGHGRRGHRRPQLT